VAVGIGELKRIREAGRGMSDPFAFIDFTLSQLRMDFAAQAPALPSAGPLVVIANHPFGALDGLSAMAAIGRVRKDLRVLANPELMGLEPLRPLLLPLDPFGKPATRHANAQALRAAARWLKRGGAVLIFPAGEVSHLNLRTISVTDPTWHATAARLIRLAQARVTPMFFAGRNSALFQFAGLIHPRLRTLLLPYELSRQRGSTVRMRVGEALEPPSLTAFETDEALTAHLRRKTYLLASEPKLPERAAGYAEPLREAVAAEALQQEISALPPEQLLLSSGDQKVFCAHAGQIPNGLQELGRLRELSFRAVGEGVGRSADIDVFDDYYEHLFIWNAKRCEIVGAYRIGRIDEIRKRFGARGLYTSTLFTLHEPFLTLLGPALELGRSFIRPEYQKSFASLLLLWKGIGEYIGRHPQYARLIGPVSISNSYRPVSRELLVRFLRARNFDHFGAALVRARRPFRQRGALRSLGLDIGSMRDLDMLSSLLAEFESDRKGVPVLLRQYLKLGGRLLGFNVDKAFSDAIDCLLLIDLRQTETRVLRKYLSEEALARFAAAHRIPLQTDVAA